jgi:hypothetical protein
LSVRKHPKHFDFTFVGSLIWAVRARAAAFDRIFHSFRRKIGIIRRKFPCQGMALAEFLGKNLFVGVTGESGCWTY